MRLYAAKAEGWTKGWVIADAHAVRSDAGGSLVIVTWWYGPDHGMGQTFGAAPDRRAAVWSTKAAAEAAARASLGPLRTTGPRRQRTLQVNPQEVER